MEQNRAINRSNLVGQKFGLVLVIEDAGNEFVGLCKKTGKKKYKSIFKYVCDCGNTGITRSNSLKSGRVTSCGCQGPIRCKTMAEGKRKQVYSGFSFLWHSYKCGAKKRGLEFSLTRDEFRELTSSNCYYCNEEPNKIRKTRFLEYKNSKSVYGYKYNGIDRIDNNKGYFISNCRPCCEFCNKMKMAHSEKEFLDKISKITRNLWL